ncbi:TPM domain-containing protein [uncultured Sphingomonas sp.]|uniref:TPM domain-containing protein n=1 Tax=uncultured Sphingomonas sp. TaxID=158754 RepID=UPI0035CA58B5
MTRLARRLSASLVVLLALVASPALAQQADAGITPPKFTGLVVDAANVLPPATRADLTAKLQKLETDTHRQLVVATIPDLQGRDVEDYGYRLGRTWGVGLRDVNNGAILFIAPNEPAGHRGPRIEVGYGLEPVLTDALSSVVINQDMLPRLKAGDVPGAMEAGTDALIAQLRASPDEAKARTDAAVTAFDKTHQRSASRSGGGGGIGLIFWLMVIGFFMLSRFRRGGGGQRYGGGSGLGSAILWGSVLGSMNRGGGGGWPGGGGGGSSGGWGDGGFSGGGGGSFGGGGASGDW